jgi:hypothetical protein
MVGLQWTEVFAKGNDFGFAVAQPVFATALTGGATPNDGNVVWGWSYKFQVTPAGGSFSQFGGLVKTMLRF